MTPARSPVNLFRLAMVLLPIIWLSVLAGCQKHGKRTTEGQESESAEPGTSSPSNEWFEEVSSDLGIDFIHEPGLTGEWFAPEIIGSGAAFLDYDNDGRMDIYLLQNGAAESGARTPLYHQEQDGGFRNVSSGSGLDVIGRGQGVAVGDINNDAFVDVLVVEYGRARLFLNRGNGTFTDISKASGIDNPHWATSAAFFDYDRDGWLDLLVVNYLDYDPSVQCTDKTGKPEYCGPDTFGPTVPRLFHNLGSDAGHPRFEDVTETAGFPSHPGPGMGVVCADFNDDGWQDALISNDNKANTLWINGHDGTFTEEAVQRGIAYNAIGMPQANMGIAIGDARRLGLIDIFITHLTEQTNVLWRQQPDGFFIDRTARAGLASADTRGTGFGTVFSDFNNDRWLDLAVVNGRVVRTSDPEALNRVIPELGPHWSPYAEPARLFANDGRGNFTDISDENPTLCAEQRLGRGLAYGDIDNDGGIDLLVTSIASPAKLYRNVAPDRGHWLTLRVIDPGLGGRDAYGSEITVVCGGSRQTAWLNPASSYACSNDPRAHFGLGESAEIDEIRVFWPDGLLESFPPMEVDRVATLRKGEGNPVSP